MPTGAPTDDPQADVKTQPVQLILTEVDPNGIDAVRANMKLRVEDAIQRRDIEELEVDDKMVSGSGTVRRIIKKDGLYGFTCETSRSYVGDKGTNNCFRLTPERMAANLRSADLFKLALGTTVYGPGGEEMRIKNILRAGNDGQGNPYGIEVTFQEDIQIDPDTFGEWLVYIIKKDATKIGG